MAEAQDQVNGASTEAPTPMYFSTQLQYLINRLEEDFDEVVKAVDLLNEKQYFLLIHLLLLESLYPKDPNLSTWLSNATTPGDVLRGFDAALYKASEFPAQLIALKQGKPSA